MKLKSPYLVAPHTTVRLARISAGTTGPYDDKEAARKDLERHRSRLNELQRVLSAEARRAVLVVLQGVDTSGKDGLIRHLFTAFEPQRCEVTSFEPPTAMEAAHDYLWRVHLATPRRGWIGIFNRSHYEDVLVTRVRGEIAGRVVRQRLEEIVNFETMLSNNGTTVLKFYLHIDQQEQKKRLQARLATPKKQWKVHREDLDDSQRWDEYAAAYEDVFRHTSTARAPWFVIPANHKWYRDVAVCALMLQALETLHPHYPKPDVNVAKARRKVARAKAR